jgi:hypothetical protein
MTLAYVLSGGIFASANGSIDITDTASDEMRRFLQPALVTGDTITYLP